MGKVMAGPVVLNPPATPLWNRSANASFDRLRNQELALQILLGDPNFHFAADRRHYLQAEDNFPPNGSANGAIGDWDQDVQFDRLPVASMKVSGIGNWRQVADCSPTVNTAMYNTLVNRAVQVRDWQLSRFGLGLWGATFVLCPHHEPNDADATTTSISGTTNLAQGIKNYQDMTERLFEIFRANGVLFWDGDFLGNTISEGVIPGWNLIGGLASNHDTDNPTWWPDDGSWPWGDQNMRFYSIDGYNNKATLTTGQMKAFLRNNGIFAVFKTWSDAKKTRQNNVFGKPLLIGILETGSAEGNLYDSNGPSWTPTGRARTKAEWFDELGDTIEAGEWPNLWLLCYWDDTVNLTTGNQWQADTSPGAWTGYQTLMARTAVWTLGGGGVVAPVTLKTEFLYSSNQGDGVTPRGGHQAQSLAGAIGPASSVYSAGGEILTNTGGDIDSSPDPVTTAFALESFITEAEDRQIIGVLAYTDGASTLRVLAATRSGHLWRKIGTGVWTQVTSLTFNGSANLAVSIVRSGAIIFVHDKYAGVIMRSTDYGDTWANFWTSATLELNNYGSLGFDGTHLIVPTTTGLFRCDTANNPANTVAGGQITPVLLSPPRPGPVYMDSAVTIVCTLPGPSLDAALWRSADFGQNWEDITDAAYMQTALYPTAVTTIGNRVMVSLDTGGVAIGRPVAVTGNVIRPLGINSAEAFGTTQLNLTIKPLGSSFGAMGTPRVSKSIAVTGIPSSQALGTPSVTKSITPTGIASAYASGTAKLNLNITCVGVASAQTFGTAEVRNVQKITCTGIPSAQAFGTPQVDYVIKPIGGSFGAVGTPNVRLNIVVPSILSAEAFGTPVLNRAIFLTGIPSSYTGGNTVVTRGAVSIQPTGIPSSYASGVVKLNLNVLPQSVTPAEAFGTPKVTLSISPSGIPSAYAAGTAQVTRNITPAGISSALAFGTAKLNLNIKPSSISSAEAFGTPSLLKAIVTTGIPSALAFGTVTVTRNINVPSIPSAEAFGTPKVTSVIRPTGIPSGELWNNPVITTKVDLQVAGVASVFASGTPRLQLNVLVPSINSSQAIGAVTVRRNERVICQGIPSAEGVGEPTLFRPSEGLYETVVDDSTYEAIVPVYLTVVDDYTFTAVVEGGV